MWPFVFVFFHLATFICIAACQNLVPLQGRIIFHSVDIPLILHIDRHLRCFHLGAMMKNVAMNICGHVFVWIYAFISLEGNT